MNAELAGVRRGAARDRTREVLAQVGIAYAADRPARKLSKGMLQRTGLAAALVSDPQLLILDEPMSGLDPVGRKEVRDLILEQQRLGRTLFFSTHILSDAETLCDEVTIMRRGALVVSGKLSDLRQSRSGPIDVVLPDVGPELETHCRARGWGLCRVAGHVRITVQAQPDLQELLGQAVAQGWSVLEVVPHHESLETLFLKSTEARTASA
jgi:ABC-2 type transport system ATP-binding protein